MAGKEGLLAGVRLILDLKRMKLAYHDWLQGRKREAVVLSWRAQTRDKDQIWLSAPAGLAALPDVSGSETPLSQMALRDYGYNWYVLAMSATRVAALITWQIAFPSKSLTRGKHMRLTPLGIILPAVLAGLLSACSSGASVQEITIDAESMLYQPASFEVTAGQPVRITFNNEDVVEHDLSVLEMPTSQMSESSDSMGGHDMNDTEMEPDLHVAAAAGGSGQVEFTPTKPGTYEFFCTVAGHKEAGMHGTLTVRSP